MDYQILCVDDEPDVLEIFFMILSMEGFHIEKATNGEEAIQKCKSTKYDLIVSDIRMPRMNGVELARNLSEKFGNNKPKIILITGYADYSEKEVLEAGADILLLKPNDINNLEYEVKRLLEVEGGHG